MIDRLVAVAQRTHASCSSRLATSPDRRGADARWRDDRGEGVISAAIAVLIMAFLGAAMWVAFKVMFDDVSGTAAEQVENIGS